MSGADTTSIMDLPSDPAASGGASKNVSFAVSENVDDSTANEIVSGLKYGSTQLPSRDIPMNTQIYTHDPQIQPTYIPASEHNDYIKEHEDNEDIIHSYNKRVEYASNLDQLYDELQIPLLIGVLFFLFRLPFFVKFLFKYFPILFFKDGNINIYGYVFTSVLFGLTYYLLSKIMTYFSRF
jgi:hypothetical protein